MSSTPRTALVLGATGATGRHLLQGLLKSNQFSKVGEYGRRVTDREQINDGVEKLEQKVIDFENISQSGLKEGKWDVVFITLGTTRAAAGSAEAFVRIDREYVLNAAKEAKSSEPGVSQRIVYLSSGGANANSPFPYLKSKGLTEHGIAEMGYSDTIIFRPGVLAAANRADFRLPERIALAVAGVLSYCSNSVQIEVATLAQSMIIAGDLGSNALPKSAGAAKEETPTGHSFTVIGNSGSLQMVKDS